MFISTCLAYSEAQFEMSQLQEVYVLKIRDAEDHAVSFTLNYTQAKILAEGVSGFLSQTPVTLLLDAHNGALLGDATFQGKIPDNSPIEQKGEDETCQLPNLSAPMATAS